MFSIAICNRKGGSGKTTTSVNLAYQISSQYPQKKVLLIDLDTQNHVMLGLNSMKTQTTLGIHKIFSHQNYTTAGLIQKTQWQNLFYIAADEEAMEINSLSVYHRLKTFIQSDFIKKQFDYIIIDTPPSHGAFLINALIAADAVLISFIPQMLDKTGLHQILKLIKRHSSKKTHYAFLPTMIQTRLKHHNKVLSELIAKEGKSRLLKGIRNSIQVSEAFDQGKPVQAYAAKSKSAYDYYMLLNEIRILWPGAFEEPVQLRDENQSIETEPQESNNIIHLNSYFR